MNTALIWLAFASVACDEAPSTERSDAPAMGHCDYVNAFSGDAECKAYTGVDWTAETAAADCDRPLILADAGDFTLGEDCAEDPVLGECVVDGGSATETVVNIWGDDPEDCGTAEMGCGFADGTFYGSETCGGVITEPPPATGGVFIPPALVCEDPHPGDVGATDDQVCTWEAISACTEEGKEYTDYASCDPVYTQRPYVAYEAVSDTSDDDPRYDDDDFQVELDWVTDQVEACACGCCHIAEASPEGPSGWYLEAPGIWTDTLDDDAVAMLAGWIDSTAFGAYPPADNNGFDRDTTGLPTSDVPRMTAFWETELTRRGFDATDFADARPFGGPLYDQLIYEPLACDDGEGVAADGTVTWGGGEARYVYVLEAGSANPTVPPNLDLPEGTLWRLDVDYTGAPVETGLAYGAVLANTVQRWPESGAPTALVAGQTYYLYVLRDVGLPLTRCLFTPS
jgi:hypothetical protein